MALIETLPQHRVPGQDGVPAASRPPARSDDTSNIRKPAAARCTLPSSNHDLPVLVLAPTPSRPSLAPDARPARSNASYTSPASLCGIRRAAPGTWQSTPTLPVHAYAHPRAPPSPPPLNAGDSTPTPAVPDKRSETPPSDGWS
ncbi:hypothetical protein B0H15DRAFT_948267 [Mycena belliarum]|uniref:Uncharacterized protein n=1 Tax=Mycena belliarum TaxID=1033014 RepID=A0AAD6XSH3_9AGAR|nr:hypothetical protein B0H15DRAFT_948267 [Mycena belliae]